MQRIIRFSVISWRKYLERIDRLQYSRSFSVCNTAICVSIHTAFSAEQLMASVRFIVLLDKENPHGHIFAVKYHIGEA